MEKEVLSFIEWCKKCKDSKLPDFDQLPSVPLYMEQVVGYINEVISDFTGTEKNITPFMVNNYVKAKIISEPDGKKYHQEHLGYLIAITLLKESLSMEEIGSLIDLDEGVSTDKSKLYRFFVDMEYEINKRVSELVLARIDDFYGRYKKSEGSKKYNEKGLRDSMGLVALRLAVTAAVNQKLAEKLLEGIGRDLYGEAGLTVAKSKTHKEMKRKAKIEIKEAERMANVKEIGKRKAAEERQKAEEKKKAEAEKRKESKAKKAKDTKGGKKK